MNKATYKGKVKNRYSNAVHLFYEYRGHEYIVTDEHNGYSKPMWEKHREEQQSIDERIKREEQRKSDGDDCGTFSLDWWEVFNRDFEESMEG